MNDFQRYILSIFVDLQESSPGEFIRYYRVVELIQKKYRQARLSITTDEIDEAINELIDDGFLEGLGTSYRLSAMGKIYWENNSLLTEVTNLAAEVKKARTMATLAIAVSLLSLGLLIFRLLR